MTELKKIRQSAGISQIDLAQKIGVSLMTLQLWERNVSSPNEENSKKLKKVLQILEEKKKD